MSRKPPNTPPPRRIWRITESAPMGEWVDPLQSTKPRPSPSGGDPAEVTTSGWMVSSFDLQRGAEVRDDPDTVSPELWDELFPTAGTKGPGEGEPGR